MSSYLSESDRILARATMLYDLMAGYGAYDVEQLELEFANIMHGSFTDAEYATLANTVDAAMIDSDVPASEFAR